MKPVRLVFSHLARQVVGSNIATKLLSNVLRQPRILMLHGVDGDPQGIRLLRANLDFLSRHFRIVPLEEIWSAETKRSDRRPKVALTFDDGLRNNLTVAYPLLKEFQAPATFFVCPGLIDSGRWLWNHECRARLKILDEGTRHQFGEEIGATDGAVEATIRHLKYLPYAARLNAAQRIRDLTPAFQPTAVDQLKYDVMSWEELKSLDPRLIAVGAHSTNHEILTGLPAEVLENEVGGCRTWLERELGRPVKHFCYPDGAYSVDVRDCVGKHFASAVTTRVGWVPDAPALFELPRIPADGASLRDLAWRMQRPGG